MFPQHFQLKTNIFLSHSMTQSGHTQVTDPPRLNQNPVKTTGGSVSWGVLLNFKKQTQSQKISPAALQPLKTPFPQTSISEIFACGAPTPQDSLPTDLNLRNFRLRRSNPSRLPSHRPQSQKISPAALQPLKTPFPLRNFRLRRSNPSRLPSHRPQSQKKSPAALQPLETPLSPISGASKNFVCGAKWTTFYILSQNSGKISQVGSWKGRGGSVSWGGVSHLGMSWYLGS